MADRGIDTTRTFKRVDSLGDTGSASANFSSPQAFPIAEATLGQYLNLR
jgi:hypothetical protein